MEDRTQGNTENGGAWHVSRWRTAAWASAGLVLLIPFVAMEFTTEVSWTIGDFVFAGVLLFGSLGAYEVAARTTGDTVYRAGVGLGIAATFLLIWGNAAVSITDSVADSLYLMVAAIGIVGIIIALVQPGSGAVAMFIAALALVVAVGIAFAGGMVPNPYVSVFEILGLTGFYVTLFVGAAWLLREAGLRKSERVAR